MKYKVISLVILGGILGAWFWYDRSASLTADAPATTTRSSEHGQRFVLVNAEKDHEYFVVVRDDRDQFVQILGPLNLADVILAGVTPEVETHDANFDGFDDVRIQTCQGATGNACFYYWLFDAYTGLYAPSKELSLLGNPRFDPQKQQVISYWKDGCAGLCFTREVYEYRGGALTIVEREVQKPKDLNQNVFINTKEELQNDKLVVVSVTEVLLPE